MYRVFGDMLSGNRYKIKLLMQFLDIAHEWVHVDILAGETHNDAFKRMNPNARVPVMELPEGGFLWESNAILNYLADGTPFLPGSRYIAGVRPTIADISLYAYTRVAGEGGFDLSAYPAVRHWFTMIEGIPGYVAMTRDNA